MIGAVYNGRYTLTGLLADGPIFALYSAKDRQTAREVSLRLIKGPFDREPAFKEALSEAVEQSHAIQSSHVERLQEMADGEHSFIIGELTRAPSLADRIRKLAPFTSPVAVSAAIGIARALDVFHKHGLVHGDVSGENVAMMADGDTKLQLGGIWKAYSASPTAGVVVLPAMAPYLAPEVSSGGSPSPASDVYSVGILLYELLTGRKPYAADSAIATAMRHVSQATPRVRDANSAVPVVLDEIVYKAMSKEPQRRYANGADLLMDLRQVQDAMRFGKNLTWPLRARDPVGNVATPSVAPRMSAVRDPAEAEARSRKRSKERDVPVWMLMAFAGVLGVVISIVASYMYINFSRPKMVLVPDLSRLSIPEARDALEKLHLKLKVGAAVPNEKVDADHIVESDPEKGTKVAENFTVTVTPSEGSSTVQVPDLKGMTLDKAKETLSLENLTLDDSTDKSSDPKVPEGAVISQKPSAQTKVSRDSKVHIVVSTGPAPAKEPDGNTDDNSSSDQTYSYTLRVKLRDIKDPVHVRIEMDDAEGTSTVYDQDGNPGDEIDEPVTAHGSKATFRIYYDGRLVKTVEESAKDATR